MIYRGHIHTLNLNTCMRVRRRKRECAFLCCVVSGASTSYTRTSCSVSICIPHIRRGRHLTHMQLHRRSALPNKYVLQYCIWKYMANDDFIFDFPNDLQFKYKSEAKTNPASCLRPFYVAPPL